MVLFWRSRSRCNRDGGGGTFRKVAHIGMKTGAVLLGTAIAERAFSTWRECRPGATRSFRRQKQADEYRRSSNSR